MLKIFRELALFANYYLLVLLFFISCGKQEFIEVGQGKQASSEDSGEETADNTEIPDEGALPPSMVMASYLTACSIQDYRAVCSISDADFSSEYFSQITLLDSEGNIIPAAELNISIENNELIISFPERYTVSAMKIGDSDVPLEDTSPPTELNLIISDGAEAVNSLNVSLTINAVGAFEMFLTNSPECSGEIIWEPYASNKNWNLNQLEGMVSVFAKFRDEAGNESACISDSIIFDSSAPGEVSDFKYDLFTGSTTSSPTISWTAGSDDVSGVSHYELSIGTSPGSDNIKSWQSVGDVTSYSFSDLSLQETSTYYANIRAVDAAGNMGSVSSGSGFTFSFCRSITVGGSWILVPGNPAYKANDFCIMKYEVKNNGGNPDSRSDGKPWVNITQDDAKSECGSLGAGYHVLTNPEWMTVATNTVNIGSNWSGGSVGSGELARGHADDNPSEICEADANDANAYVEGNCTGAAQGDDFNQKRTHTLSNGEVIWDLSANVWEWIDYNNAADKPSPNTDAFYEYSLPVVGTVTMPLTDLIPQIGIDNLWNSSQSIGQYYPGVNGAGGALYRGGSYFFGNASGVFGAAMELTSTSLGPDIGFRCAIDVP